MLTRFHLWLQNILVVNSRWRQVESCVYIVASTSIGLCKLVKYILAYLIRMYSSYVSHIYHTFNPFTKFTDQ